MPRCGQRRLRAQDACSANDGREEVKKLDERFSARWVRSLRSEVSFCECAPGAGLQVLLEPTGSFLVLEFDHHHKLPRSMFGGVMGLPCVVPGQALMNLGGEAHVVPFRIRHASKDINVSLGFGILHTLERRDSKSSPALFGETNSPALFELCRPATARHAFVAVRSRQPRRCTADSVCEVRLRSSSYGETAFARSSRGLPSRSSRSERRLVYLAVARLIRSHRRAKAGGGGGNRTRVRRSSFAASTCLSGSRFSHPIGQDPARTRWKLSPKFRRASGANVRLAHLNGVLPELGGRSPGERSRVLRG